MVRFDRRRLDPRDQIGDAVDVRAAGPVSSRDSRDDGRPADEEGVVDMDVSLVLEIFVAEFLDQLWDELGGIAMIAVRPFAGVGRLTVGKRPFFFDGQMIEQFQDTLGG